MVFIIWYGIIILLELINKHDAYGDRSVFMVSTGVRFRVQPNSLAHLQCYYAKGSSTSPTVKWYHRGEMISEGQRKEGYDNSEITYIKMSNLTYAHRFKVVQNHMLSQLSIHDARITDIGKYKCIVDNQVPLFTTVLMRINTILPHISWMPSTQKTDAVEPRFKTTTSSVTPTSHSSRSPTTANKEADDNTVGIEQATQDTFKGYLILWISLSLVCSFAVIFVSATLSYRYCYSAKAKLKARDILFTRIPDVIARHIILKAKKLGTPHHSITTDISTSISPVQHTTKVISIV